MTVSEPDESAAGRGSWREWRVPLSAARRTLREAYESLRPYGLDQRDVPLIIQLVENPKYDVPGIELFPGAADLRTHDIIHIVLGRGLLLKDEAFVIGFTMGSTDRVGATEERIYQFFARHLFPGAYRFGDEEVRVFKDAVRLGYVSDCRSLSEVDYDPFFDSPLGHIRAELGIEDDLLRAYYAIEKRRYPNSPESQRLLD
jgi:hypothetical protein